MNRQERIEGDRGRERESGRERERGAQGPTQSEKQESQKERVLQMLGTEEIRGPRQGRGMPPGPEPEESWFEEGNAHDEGAESQSRRRARGGAVAL